MVVCCVVIAQWYGVVWCGVVPGVATTQAHVVTCPHTVATHTAVYATQFSKLSIPYYSYYCCYFWPLTGLMGLILCTPRAGKAGQETWCQGNMMTRLLAQKTLYLVLERHLCKKVWLIFSFLHSLFTSLEVVCSPGRPGAAQRLSRRHPQCLNPRTPEQRLGKYHTDLNKSRLRKNKSPEAPMFGS